MISPSFSQSQISKIWQEMIDLMPKIMHAGYQGNLRHQSQINPLPNHEKIERGLIKNLFDILRRKWLLEIVYALSTHEILFFNEIKRHLYEISSKTLSKRLSEMKNEGIVHRHIEEGTQPIRVNYSLTEYGRGLYYTIMPFFLFFVKHQIHQND